MLSAQHMFNFFSGEGASIDQLVNWIVTAQEATTEVYFSLVAVVFTSECRSCGAMS